MGYLDNSSITVDAILTKRGRELLSRNDGSFKITQFSLGDDEIDYSLFNENHPNGSQYSGEAIENMPLIEAIPDETNIMRHKLITLARGTSILPVISAGTTRIELKTSDSFTLDPSTLNFGGTAGGQKEPSGYYATIHDARLLASFEGIGRPQDGATITAAYTATEHSETVLGNTFSLNSITSNTLFGSNTALLTTITIEGVDSGAQTSITLEVSKLS
jgi:hypothetical protein